MIESIIYGIKKKLYNEFKDVEIYTTNIEQGLTEPCFFIDFLNSSGGLFLNKKYKNIYNFVIRYMPKNGEKECYNVLERLEDVLELIEVNNTLTRFSDLNGQIIDNMLVVELMYTVFSYKLTQEVKMNELNKIQGVNNEE